jgi:hypothetical protein
VLTFHVPYDGFDGRSAFDKLPQAFGDRCSPLAFHINGFRTLGFVASVAPIHKNLPHSALSKKVAYLRQLLAEGMPVVGAALSTHRSNDPTAFTRYGKTHLVSKLVFPARFAFGNAFHLRLMQAVNLAGVLRAKVSQTVPRIEPHPAHVPFFEGPKPFVRIAHGAARPVFRRANHSPSLPECPNGDLLTVWFFSLSEVDLTTSNAASRPRFGAPEWEPASAFWDAQDANALQGCQKMDLSPETRSSQQTQLGIGRNHRASRLNGVSGDQTVERIAVHVWKFARAIDEQFV